ncbi:hypothetical protein [Pseudorhodoplanes sp.]|uniref:hypothetical protein n=1 Tax=Pseudorhodoplanes sp. TaxID=1934341 RepID=UPI002C5D8DA9|nr:hypothetical protein [Pseudorhodoplanes sp.]HWV44164.1 hypothetical protein [Pseudorhodoplanes sp.]
MKDLIERLERATGPDAYLELDIANHVAPDGYWSVLTAPRYTESIDAALKLFEHGLPRGLHLYRNTAPDMGGKDWVVSHQSPTTRVAARSWPLALCIAALKARDSSAPRSLEKLEAGR